jgi:hypothetical protein
MSGNLHHTTSSDSSSPMEELFTIMKHRRVWNTGNVGGVWNMRQCGVRISQKKQWSVCKFCWSSVVAFLPTLLMSVRPLGSLCVNITPQILSKTDSQYLKRKTKQRLHFHSSIHLDEYTLRRGHSWDGYVRYIKVLISLSFSLYVESFIHFRWAYSDNKRWKKPPDISCINYWSYELYIKTLCIQKVHTKEKNNTYCMYSHKHRHSVIHTHIRI